MSMFNSELAKSQAHHLESDHDVTRPAGAHGATLQLHPTLPHLVVGQGMEPQHDEHIQRLQMGRDCCS